MEEPLVCILLVIMLATLLLSLMNINDSILDGVWFLYLHHFKIKVPGGVVAQRGDWPPRYRDLMPLDFLLWGYLKERERDYELLVYT